MPEAPKRVALAKRDIGRLQESLHGLFRLGVLTRAAKQPGKVVKAVRIPGHSGGERLEDRDPVFFLSQVDINLVKSAGASLLPALCPLQILNRRFQLPGSVMKKNGQLMAFDRLEIEERIDRLLGIIEASDAVFLRNGSETTAEAFAAHLRRKFAISKPQALTAERFIEEVAGPSTASGDPCRVRLSDGQVIEAAIWMRQQAGVTPLRDVQAPK